MAPPNSNSRLKVSAGAMEREVQPVAPTARDNSARIGLRTPTSHGGKGTIWKTLQAAKAATSLVVHGSRGARSRDLKVAQYKIPATAIPKIDQFHWCGTEPPFRYNPVASAHVRMTSVIQRTLPT